MTSKPKILVLDIENTGGAYKIYSNGGVWSEKSHRFLTEYPNQEGYLGYKISLSTLDGKKTARKVSTHRLLALAFIPNPDNLETVNHKDKNKLNNTLENLEWCSREDNVKHGLQKVFKAISPTGEIVEFTGQVEFCKKNNLTQSNFSRMLLGQRRICQGWTRYE
jgi:hypothetical protein